MRVHLTNRHLRLIAPVALAAALVTGCTSGSASPGPTGGSTTGTAPTGPYAAGVVRYVTGTGDPVVIWYPADRRQAEHLPTYSYSLHSWNTASVNASTAFASLPDTYQTIAVANAPAAAPPAHGFPVVLFSHGIGLFPEQSSFLTADLATWGYVVVAPDHRGSDLAALTTGTFSVEVNLPSGRDANAADLRDALAFVRDESARAGSPLHGMADTARVGVIGYADGAGVALAVAADRDVATYVLMAPMFAAGIATSKPGTVLAGAADTIATIASVRALRAQLRGATAFDVFPGAGHNAFDDLCYVTSGGRTLPSALSDPAHLPLVLQEVAKVATDGCFPPDTSPASLWPDIQRDVLAQLRTSLPVG